MNGPTSASLTERVVDRPAPGGPDLCASDVMIRHPKVLDARATVDEARAALTDDHVHMVLLTEGSTLVGTLVRTDLPPPIQRSDQGSGEGSGPALPWSRLRNRTVPSATSADAARELLIARGLRRLAVVDLDGTLLGLMCFKRSRTGFCSDEDVASRARSRVLSRQAAD
ncbi:CBS domain-containing protein [Nocardioides bigeumensis]|uniref:CBS domain-containing protein n=1 Tax=Nocardioides bigeumensis TaxID=433657 RepID=A0ABP5K8L3_9ACTN